MLTSTIYLGVDPGASGGIACIYPDGSVHTQKMPDTVREVWEVVGDFGIYKVTCYIEKVGGFIGNEAGDNEKGQKQRNRASGHTMFTFGRNYGYLEMALTAARIPYEEIPPQRWVKILGISPRKKTETKTEWKNRCKDFAQKLFPTVTVTLRTCDALLIAEACHRSNR